MDKEKLFFNFEDNNFMIPFILELKKKCFQAKCFHGYVKMAKYNFFML